MVETGDVRASKKRRTRQRIAEAAMRLFAGRGFDAVTVAEIAREAGVTEKTVFNHFPSKDDLVYSNDAAFEAALLDRVRTRRPGQSVFRAIEGFLLDRYGRMEFNPEGMERARTMAALVQASAVLRDRERRIHARYADLLCDLIATEQRAASGDIRPRVTAEALIAVHRETIAAVRDAMLSSVPAQELPHHALATARRAFSLLGQGLTGYARAGRERSSH
jgi:AcrR family transcriptional regulator